MDGVILGSIIGIFRGRTSTQAGGATKESHGWSEKPGQFTLSSPSIERSLALGQRESHGLADILRSGRGIPADIHIISCHKAHLSLLFREFAMHILGLLATYAAPAGSIPLQMLARWRLIAGRLVCALCDRHWYGPWHGNGSIRWRQCRCCRHDQQSHQG